MKKLILSVLLSFVSFVSFSQWLGSTTPTGSIQREGSVGIGSLGAGVPNPLTALHVTTVNGTPGTVLFDGGAGTVPVSGAGTRFMWVPELYALRAGKVTGTNWDFANVGVGTIAGGLDCIASGALSMAHGHTSRATGDVSFALGAGTLASGLMSVAMGTNTTSSGFFSFSQGSYCISSGDNAVAFGATSKALGDYSVALGYVSTSSGNGSFTMGARNTASGHNATALGYYSVAGDSAAIAAGDKCEANGLKSVALGSHSEANGSNAMALGLYTKASNTESYTIGSGVNTGSWNYLDNNISKSLMVGFNSDKPTLFVQQSPGLGTWGKVGIGVTSGLQGTLHIKMGVGYGHGALYSDTRINQGGNCRWDNAAFIVGADYAKAIYVQKSTTECDLEGPTTETFHVYGNGFTEATAYGTISDRRFKKDIKTIENPIELVKQLNGVSYKFDIDMVADPSAEGMPTLGFIAQEVEKVIPEATFKNEKGYYSLNYNAIIPILTNAIKEQQKGIEAQQTRIDALEKEINELKELMVKGNSTNMNDGKSSSDNEKGYLSQNVPNPFTQNTDISYKLPAGTKTAAIGVYDLNGKEIKSYPLSAEATGHITIDGGTLQPGIYVYAIIINGVLVESKKMVLNR